jgi:hypothetical protein
MVGRPRGLQQDFNQPAMPWAEPRRNRPEPARKTTSAQGQETGMNPTTINALGQARIAGFYQEAERDRTTRAARLACGEHCSHAALARLATVLARRVRTILAAPGPRPAPPEQAPKATS